MESLLLKSLEEEGQQDGNSVSILTNSTSLPEDSEKPSGFFGTVGDITKGVASGAIKEVENVVQTGHDLANFVDDKFLGDRYVDNETDFDFIPEALKPKGGAGKTAQAIAAFATGWYALGGTKIASTVGRATSKLKVFQAMPKLGKVVDRAIAGMPIDFVTANSSDGRLADVLLDNDIMGNAVVEYLSSDPDDSAVEARFKNTIEGFFVSAALDGVVGLFKSMRNVVKAGRTQGVAGSLAAQKGVANTAIAQVTNEELAERALKESGLTPTKEAEKALAKKQAYKKIAKTADPEAMNYRKFSNPGRDDLILLNKPLYEATGADRMSMTELATNTADVVEKFSEMTGDIFGATEMFREVVAEGTAHAEEATKAIAGTVFIFDQKILPEFDRALVAVADGAEGSEEYLRGITARVFEAAVEMKNFSRWTGRAVKAHDILRFIAREDADTAVKSVLDEPLKAAKEFVANLTLDELKELGAEVVFTAKNGGSFITPLLKRLPKGHGLAKAVVNKDPMWWRFLETIRYNSMLSSIRGRVRDGISMTTKSLLMPVEKSVSGAVEGFLTDGGMAGAVVGAKNGRYYTHGMFSSMSTAFKAAKLSYRYGTSILRGGNLRDGISADDVLGEFTGLKALGKDGLGGKVITTPTRIMAAMDEFYAQMHYYAETYQKLMHGLNKSKIAAAITDPKDYKQFVDDYIRDNIDKAYKEVLLPDGKIVKLGGVYEQGIKMANDATFQTPLGKTGRGFHMIVNSCKPFKFLFPFVKTPINLLKDGLWIRTPIGGMTDLALAIKAKDNNAIAEAAGHMVTGTMLWGTAYGLFKAGKITGQGPKNNPTAKSALYENGWQPYSVKIGDSYVPINAFEPFSNGIALLADILETYEMTDGVGIEELGSATLGALTSFVKDRTYFKGIADVIDAIEAPQGYKANMLLSNQITSFFPTAFRDAAQFVDPTIREARGILEQVEARTLPSLFDLKPKHNWLTGDPSIYSHGGGLGVFSPIQKSDDAMDVVFEELGKSRGITQPRRKISNIDLSSEEYSEYCRLHGKIKINGKTMYEALRDEIMSDRYDVKRYKYQDTNDYELAEHRSEALEKIVKDYREKAQGELLRLYPALQQRGAKLPGSGSSNRSNPFSSITSF